MIEEVIAIGTPAPAPTGLIRLTVGHASVVSTNSIPTGYVVTSVLFDVGTAYSAGASIAATCNSQALATNATPQSTGITEQTTDVLISAGAVVHVNISGAPSAGAATVSVFYELPLN
jgi:hypothetical protein